MNIQDRPIDFEIIQGDDHAIQVTFKDEDGVAINITGYTVYFTVKKKPDADEDDSTAVLKKEVSSHTDPTNGITNIEIAGADTEDVEPRRYFYDLQLKDASDKISSSKYGVLELIPDITNRTT